MFAPKLMRLTQNAEKCICKITHRQYVSFDRLQDDNQGIAVIGLNSHNNRNALSKQMLHEFNETLDRVYHDSNIRTLVIRSLVAGVFCAGK